MSKIIPTYELSGYQQDILWRDVCPYCTSKILDTQRTADLAFWICGRCDIYFRCE